MQFEFDGKKSRLEWYSQDIVTASLNAIYGKEILCRARYDISDKFIPMHKLIPYIYTRSALLLEMTCQQLKEIALMLEDTEIKYTFWVNFSGRLVSDDLLFEQLWLTSLSTLGVHKKKRLILEICEDDISDEVVIHRVAFLKKHGFVIAMDDFGSGHSNLIRLHQIDFDIIKLDLKLLTSVPSNLWASSYYREIIALCSSKGAVIVAEGVEEKVQSEFARWAGVDLIQGFYFSTPKPLSVANLAA